MPPVWSFLEIIALPLFTYFTIRGCTIWVCAKQSVRMPSDARTMSAGNFEFRQTHRKFIICNLHIFTFVVITLESFEACVLIAVA